MNLGVWTQRRLAASWWQSFALPRVARRTSASQNVAHKVFICVSILRPRSCAGAKVAYTFPLMKCLIAQNMQIRQFDIGKPVYLFVHLCKNKYFNVQIQIPVQIQIHTSKDLFNQVRCLCIHMLKRSAPG